MSDNYDWFEDGLSVTCVIEGVTIEDAKLSKAECFGIEWFVCQNLKDGTRANDRKGYDFSWSIGEGINRHLAIKGVLSLKPLVFDEKKEPKQESKEDNEVVTKAPHYNNHPSGVECRDIINILFGSLSHASKYVWRCGKKDSKEKELGKVLDWLNEVRDLMINCEKLHLIATTDNYIEWYKDLQNVIENEKEGYKKLYYIALCHLIESEHVGYVDMMSEVIEQELSKS